MREVPDAVAHHIANLYGLSVRTTERPPSNGPGQCCGAGSILTGSDCSSYKKMDFQPLTYF